MGPWAGYDLIHAYSRAQALEDGVLYALIGELAQRGVGIVLVSSDLPELLGLSHRLLVLNQGRPTASLHYTEASPEKVLTAAALVNSN